jgi:hypothetical protein
MRADGKRLATVVRTEVGVFAVTTVFTKTRRKAVIYTVAISKPRQRLVRTCIVVVTLTVVCIPCTMTILHGGS